MFNLLRNIAIPHKGLLRPYDSETQLVIFTDVASSMFSFYDVLDCNDDPLYI